jgi:hypothetical protein
MVTQSQLVVYWVNPNTDEIDEYIQTLISIEKEYSQ